MIAQTLLAIDHHLTTGTMETVARLADRLNRRMTPMMFGADFNTPVTIGIVIPLVLTVAGIIGALRVRGIKASASALIMSFAITVSGIMVVTGMVLYFNDRRVYDNCVGGVDRSEGNRAVHSFDFDKFGQLALTLQKVGVDPIILAESGILTWRDEGYMLLDKELPTIDRQDRCGPPP